MTFSTSYTKIFPSPISTGITKKASLIAAITVPTGILPTTDLYLYLWKKIDIDLYAAVIFRMTFLHPGSHDLRHSNAGHADFLQLGFQRIEPVIICYDYKLCHLDIRSGKSPPLLLASAQRAQRFPKKRESRLSRLLQSPTERRA